MAGHPQTGPKDAADHDPRERVISTQKARGGIELHRMRYVLGFGIAGVVIALLAAWYILIGV